MLAVAGLLFGTWLGLRWPWLLPLFALAAAPLRVPVHLGGQEAFLLVPLYAVIACAWLVLVVELVRGERHAIIGPFVGLPVALYLLLASASLAWSADTHQGAITTAFFLCRSVSWPPPCRAGRSTWASSAGCFGSTSSARS